MKTLQPNPNFLAVLDAAFKSGKLNKDEYTKKYEDLLEPISEQFPTYN